MRDYRAKSRQIEPRSAWAYLFLACGRTTTPDEQEFYGVWKPRRGLYYCESCHSWQEKLKGARLASYFATRPRGWPCAAGSGNPSMGGTDGNQPRQQSPVHVQMGLSRRDSDQGNQIPLPGMPNRPTPKNVPRRHDYLERSK